MVVTTVIQNGERCLALALACRQWSGFQVINVCAPIEGPSPLKDPPLKIRIEDPPKSKIAIIQDPL